MWFGCNQRQANIIHKLKRWTQPYDCLSFTTDRLIPIIVHQYMAICFAHWMCHIPRSMCAAPAFALTTTYTNLTENKKRIAISPIHFQLHFPSNSIYFICGKSFFVIAVFNAFLMWKFQSKSRLRSSKSSNEKPTCRYAILVTCNVYWTIWWFCMCVRAYEGGSGCMYIYEFYVDENHNKTDTNITPFISHSALFGYLMSFSWVYTHYTYMWIFAECVLYVRSGTLLPVFAPKNLCLEWRCMCGGILFYGQCMAGCVFVCECFCASLFHLCDAILCFLWL